MEDKQNLSKKLEEKIEEDIDLIIFLTKRGWEQLSNPDGIFFGWRHKDAKNPLAIMSACTALRVEDIKKKRKGLVIEVNFENNRKNRR